MNGGSGGPPTADGTPQRGRSQALPIRTPPVAPLVASVGPSGSCTHVDVTASVLGAPVAPGSGRAFSHSRDTAGGAGVDYQRSSPVRGSARDAPLRPELARWAECVAPATERSQRAPAGTLARCTKRRRVLGPESPAHVGAGVVDEVGEQVRVPPASPARPACHTPSPPAASGASGARAAHRGSHFARTPSGGEPGDEPCGEALRNEAAAGCGDGRDGGASVPAGAGGDSGAAGAASGCQPTATRAGTIGDGAGAERASAASAFSPAGAAGVVVRGDMTPTVPVGVTSVAPSRTRHLSVSSVSSVSSPAPSTPMGPDGVPVTPALRPAHITSPPALRGRKRSRSAMSPPTPNLVFDEATAATRAALANARWAGSLVQHRHELQRALGVGDVGVSMMAAAGVGPAGVAAAAAARPVAVRPVAATKPKGKGSKKHKKKRDRCPVCRAKLRSLGFTCRCGREFCAKHRYAETHSCSFDYASVHREKLKRENPEVRAPKLPKIL